MKKLLIFIVFSLLLVVNVHAADYYFASAGDDGGAGTEGDPWQTITKINSTSFSAGDNIYLNKGDTWTIGSGEVGIDVDFNGSTGNEITITSYGTGAKPIITAAAQTGDGIRGNNAIEVCIFMGAGYGNYVIIDDLELDAAADESAIDGYDGARSHVVIQNCTIGGSGWAGEALIRMDGSDNDILNNTFDATAGYSKNVELAATGSGGHTISGNIFRGMSYHGSVRVVYSGNDGDTITIEKNYFYDFPSSPLTGIAIVVRTATGTTGTRTTVIRNNVINLRGSGITNDSYLLGFQWYYPQAITHTIYYNNNTVISDGVGEGNELGTGCVAYMYNNIVYDLGLAANNADNGTQHYRNNIFYSCNTLFDGTPTTNSGNVTTDPAIVNSSMTAVTDAMLTASSTNAIDGGYGTGGVDNIPSDDYAGTARGSTVDIGAYEYGTATDPVVVMDNSGQTVSTTPLASITGTATASSGRTITGVTSPGLSVVCDDGTWDELEETFEVTNTTLSEGLNTKTFTATDSESDTGQADFTVTYTPETESTMAFTGSGDMAFTGSGDMAFTGS